MPTSSPVVNGMLSRPASSRTRSRTAGSLSGEPKCASPRTSYSRVLVVSSIIPIERGHRLEPAASPPTTSRPGLRCGSRPVSSSTRTAIARTYSSVES